MGNENKVENKKEMQIQIKWNEMQDKITIKIQYENEMKMNKSCYVISIGIVSTFLGTNSIQTTLTFYRESYHRHSQFVIS